MSTASNELYAAHIHANILMGRVFKVDFLRPTRFLDVKADKKRGRGGHKAEFTPRVLMPTKKG